MRFSVKSESKLLQTFNIHISVTKLSTGKTVSDNYPSYLPTMYI